MKRRIPAVCLLLFFLCACGETAEPPPEEIPAPAAPPAETGTPTAAPSDAEDVIQAVLDSQPDAEARRSESQHSNFNVTSVFMRQRDRQWDYQNVPEAAAERFRWDGMGPLPG